VEDRTRAQLVRRGNATMTFRTTLALALAAAWLAGFVPADSQETRPVPRVGIIGASSRAAARHQLEAFREGLRELGHVDRQNVVIEERWADGKVERFAPLIAELQRSKVDVIVVGSAAGARVAKEASITTPVVFVAVTDPIGSGIIQSLARPGGNLTGTSLVIGEDAAGKWVELVKTALPRTATVAALAHPEHPMTQLYVKGMEAAARTLGVRLAVFQVRDAEGLEHAFSEIARTSPGALIVTASPLFSAHRKRIAEFALARGIGTIGYERQFAADGMLVSYGPSIADSYRRGAAYVDRILKGAKPADLPVEQPTRFELLVNLKTARALRVTIPQSLLQRADEVIQ
jgi:ABC-type uncharacterized transport system substrate-binding protein